MNGSSQRNPILAHLSDDFFKHSLVVFRDHIFITRYYPFRPAIRCFCMIVTLHSRQIQAFTEAVLPRFKWTGTIRHGTPYPHNTSFCVSLCQMRDFTKMAVCVIPQFLDKAVAVWCWSLFSNDNKFFLYHLNHSVSPPPGHPSFRNQCFGVWRLWYWGSRFPSICFP